MAEGILVTGATGFVGGAVLRRLLLDSRRCVVATVRSGDVQVPAEVRAVQVPGLSGDTDWSDCVKGMTEVVHCAARVHVMNGKEADPLAVYRRTNVAGTLALARQAAQSGVSRFVFVSSIKVNGERTLPGRPFHADDAPAPEDAYGVSKWEAEQGLFDLARETGLEVTIIRLPLVYGPGVRGNFSAMLRWVSREIPLPLGAVRHNRRSLVGLDNVADLIATCLDHPAAANQVFLAGDGEDLSTAALLERLAGAMNLRARLVPVPIWMLHSAAALLGKRDVARRLCGSLQVDISKAREMLGWEPPASVDEGLRKSVGSLAC
jgi:nucleoside-diphosphate-sugar epimerase